jgi:putative ABC transport system substrate-binding protein
MASNIERRKFLATLGGAAAWPLVARAQQGGKIPTVGYLWHAGSPQEEAPYFEALLEGFARLGYVNGRNIKLEHRFPNETPERFKSMAAELVSLNVDVLMGGAVASPYLRDATTKIPIVFMFVPDPVGMKLVQSIARPGGNITGLSNFGRDVAGKRLQLLKEIVPGLSRVALLINSDHPTTPVFIEVMQAAADQLGLVLQTFDARSLEEIEPALDAMVRAGMQAVTPVQGGLFFQARALIPKLAIARRLPMLAYSRETFEYGALLSYAADQVEMCRRSAVYADKILKGAKPGDLPVEQPTKFEFLINLKTAKTLGLAIPLHLQQLADEVIE